MSPLWRKLGCVGLVAALALPCAAQSEPKAKAGGKVTTGIRRKAAKAAKAPATAPEPVVQEAPPTPPPPSRPFEMSPVPPRVTYDAGQLTISAPNSTLADILSAVRMRTGTKVDFPSSASQERVAVQLGPGSPRDVLAQLLHGSPFDYILLGSDQDPNAVTQIMLTRREGGPATAAGSGNIPNRAPVQPEPADEDAENDTAPVQQAQPQPAQPVPAGPGQVLSGPPAMQTAPEQNAGGAQPNPVVPAGTAQPNQETQPKTPEQLLQELQRMQREEQQKRQQRPPR